MSEQGFDQPTHLDLFSGIGGFSIAAERVGFRTIAFCEKEPYCQQVLKEKFGARFKGEKWPRDIRQDIEQYVADSERLWELQSKGSKRDQRRRISNSGGENAIQPKACLKWDGRPLLHPDIFSLDGTQYRGVTLITGGFPCQPFSCAGKRKGKADDRHLWPQMLRVIKEAQPTYILAENVPGIINLELDNVLSDLEGQGYETGTLIIPACAVDARHRRDRVWIVAHAVMRGSQKRRAENDGSMAGCSGQRETTSNDISTAAEPSQDVAHTNQGGIRRPRAQGNEGHASFCGEDVADTQGVRFQGERPTREQEPAAHDGAGLPVCGREDVSNPSMRLNSGIGAQRNQRELENGDGESHQQPCLWCPEPELGRVAYGVPNRAHRLRALGNAIVPQVAEVILKAIYQQIIAEGTLTPSQSQTAPAASAPVRG